jgi:hypothetical protein
MKPKTKQQTGGYGGCLVIIIIMIALWFAACSTQKNGCGTENYKHKFSK